MDATAPSAAIDAAASHRRALRVLSGVLLCMLLAALDQTAVVPAVPAIAGDLHGFGHLSWIVTAYLLTATSFTPIFGKLSDMYGRRALLLPAIVLFVVASVLCAVAQDLAQLIAFRALQGVGGAGLISMAQASIADAISPRERGRYQVYISAMWAIASVAGPMVGGWLADQLSWRWIFWVNVPLGATAFVLSAWALRIIPVRRQHVRIDYSGAALILACTTLCLLAMSWGGTTYAWLSPEILGCGGAALVLLGALVVQQRRAAEPILPLRLFGNVEYVCAVLISFMASAAVLGATLLLPLFFQLLGGADASASGTLLVPFLFSFIFGAYLAGRGARWLGRLKGIVVSGLVTSVIGFLLLVWVGAAAGPVGTALFMVLMGIGLGSCMPSSIVMGQNAADRRDMGAATGALLLLRSMGGAFGSTIAGAVLAVRFAARMASEGLGRGIEFGALRGRANALAGLDPATLGAVRRALAASFGSAFLACALLAAVGLAAALALRDLPLRSES